MENTKLFSIIKPTFLQEQKAIGTVGAVGTAVWGFGQHSLAERSSVAWALQRAQAVSTCNPPHIFELIVGHLCWKPFQGAIYTSWAWHSVAQPHGSHPKFQNLCSTRKPLMTETMEKQKEVRPHHPLWSRADCAAASGVHADDWHSRPQETWAALSARSAHVLPGTCTRILFPCCRTFLGFSSYSSAGFL